MFAQEMVLHDYFSRTPDSDIEDILYFAAGVELVDAGFSSTRDSSHDFEYRLLTEYTLENDRIEIRYELSRAESDTPLAQTVMQAPVDTDLDREIASVVRQLRTSAGLTSFRSGQASIAGFGTPPSETRIELGFSDQEAQPEPEAEAAQPESEADVDQAVDEQQDDIVSDDIPDHEVRKPPDDPGIHSPTVATRVDAESFAGPEISLGSGGMLIFGEGSTYFRHGVFGRLAGGWVAPYSAFSLTYSGTLSMYRLFTNDNIAGGSLILTTLGPEIRLGTPADGSGRIGFRVSTGAALVTVATNDEALSKLAPYIDTALEAGIMLGNRISIGLALGFTGVAEESLTLTGFTSAINTAVRL